MAKRKRTVGIPFPREEVTRCSPAEVLLGGGGSSNSTRARRTPGLLGASFSEDHCIEGYWVTRVFSPTPAITLKPEMKLKSKPSTEQHQQKRKTKSKLEVKGGTSPLSGGAGQGPSAVKVPHAKDKQEQQLQGRQQLASSGMKFGITSAPPSQTLQCAPLHRPCSAPAA